MKHATILTSLLALSVAAAACGGSGSTAGSPTGPSSVSSSSSALDISGFWQETGGGSLSIRFQQSGPSVTSTATFTDSNSVFGRYTGSCTGNGTLSGSSLTGNESCQLTAQPTGAPIDGCEEKVTSTYTVQGSGRQMNGSYTQTDTCNGGVVFTKSGSITLVKQ
jgi:hypothetical protein